MKGGIKLNNKGFLLPFEYAEYLHNTLTKDEALKRLNEQIEESNKSNNNFIGYFLSAKDEYEKLVTE